MPRSNRLFGIGKERTICLKVTVALLLVEGNVNTARVCRAFTRAFSNVAARLSLQGHALYALSALEFILLATSGFS